MRSAASPRAVDTEPSAGERLGRPDCCVDSRRLPHEVRIKRADDDAGVIGAFVVEANEVLAIERHGSGGLILLDLVVDLVPMGSRVSPCVHEFLGPEGWIAA